MPDAPGHTNGHDEPRAAGCSRPAIAGLPRRRTALRLGGLALAAAGLGACRVERPDPTAATAQPTLDPAQVARGRVLYTELCAACHGPAAEGAPHWRTPGPQAAAPAHDESGHTWRHGDAVLSEVIREGFRDPRRPEAPPSMPGFGDRLDEDEVEAIVSYFKSLWSDRQRASQIEETLHPAATAAP